MLTYCPTCVNPVNVGQFDPEDGAYTGDVDNGWWGGLEVWLSRTLINYYRHCVGRIFHFTCYFWAVFTGEPRLLWF